ncbi:hypothetical protein EDF66_101342 [Sphingobacterium sp. JUb20]|nr:hypothetical protein [Sphingobacterium sp. JUb21]TCR10528.1 hypothetical protein EDF66_101342 [Sphingobacterium sp. JUb20]
MRSNYTRYLPGISTEQVLTTNLLRFLLKYGLRYQSEQRTNEKCLSTPDIQLSYLRYTFVS